MTKPEAVGRMAYLLQWGRARGSAEIIQAGAAIVQGTGLQWGRARESAEINPAAINALAAQMLQLGRARESAEMEVGISMTLREWCFNGAALVRARKSRLRAA